MKPSGVGIITDPEARRENVEVPTYQCVHCGRHWIPEPGSGKKRGWCMRCNGPVCGPACERCIPQERFIELLEQGVHPHRVDLDRLPVSVPVLKRVESL